ncbi:MAG: hypothetical protein J0I41_18775 [Filimonas sp.]|nr:hypothetical protein [Filimonas sp.]
MPGYSTTPLIKKLGILPSSKVLLVNAPDTYADWLEIDIAAQLTQKPTSADFIHFFTTSSHELKKVFKKLVQTVNPGTVIWISWYKKSSGKATDVTEDRIREVVLPTGWVDVKVCAVSDEWSGLKIVRRKN